MKYSEIDPKELTRRCLAHLPYTPEPQQLHLLEALARFVADADNLKVFVLNGFAGTGKTSLVASLVKALADYQLRTVTLAPTGRAAKVASGFSGRMASTIHRRIYRPAGAEGAMTGSYVPAPNRSADTLFLVDEASMITDTRGPDSLLLHLVHYVYSAPGCAMILIGDVAQLPPVGHSDSPAMLPGRLSQLQLHPVSFTLDKPMRQAAGSGILSLSTAVRRAIFNSTPLENFRLPIVALPDVESVSSSEFGDTLSSSWATAGIDQTIIITRSNKRANRFNAEIRARVLFAEDPLQRGERIVVSKNDYFWRGRNSLKGFIANGESAVISWVGTPQKAFGRWYVEAELEFDDDPMPVTALIMLRSLMADTPAIPRDEMERLRVHIAAGKEGSELERSMAAETDPYFNALQVKYGYCLTCHKAQGGQWRHVYLDVGAIAPDASPRDFYRWLYTAVTRATEKLYLLNPGPMFRSSDS